MTKYDTNTQELEAMNGYVLELRTSSRVGS